MDDLMLDYMERANPDLYSVWETLDEEGDIFRAKKLKNGFTFLMPNQDYTAEIQKLLNRGKEHKVVDILKRLVITEYLQTPREWNSAKDNISNLHNKCLDVKSVSNNEITLLGDGGDVTLSLDRRFNRESHPIAVYNIRSGYPSVGSRKASRKVVAKPTRKGGDEARIELYNIVMGSHNAYRSCLSYVASFLQFLGRQKASNLLASIAPHLDYCPITNFILLFEPYKGARYFIDNSVINDWYDMGEVSLPKNPRSVFMRVVKFASTLDAHAYANAAVVNNAMAELRDDARDQRIPSSLVALIGESYDELINRNMVGDAANVLNKEAHTYMKARCSKNYNLKLMQDEIRGIVASYLNEGQKIALSEACKSLRLCPTYNNRKITDANTNTASANALACFINTSDFLHVLPTKKGLFGGVPANYYDINPVNTKHFDLVAMKMETLNSVPDGGSITKSLREDLTALLESGERPDEETIRLINMFNNNTKQIE